MTRLNKPRKIITSDAFLEDVVNALVTSSIPCVVARRVQEQCVTTRKARNSAFFSAARSNPSNMLGALQAFQAKERVRLLGWQVASIDSYQLASTVYAFP